MTRNVINSPFTPDKTPYSDAVWAGDIIFLSGRIGLAENGELISGNAADQTRQAIANIQSVLRLAGLGLDNVVKSTVYLASMDDYGAMNDVYRQSFDAPLPARTTIAAAGLPKNALVEIEVIARLGRHSGS